MKRIIVLTGSNFDDMYFSNFFKAYRYAWDMNFVTPEYDHQGCDLTKQKAAKGIKELDFAELNS